MPEENMKDLPRSGFPAASIWFGRKAQRSLMYCPGCQSCYSDCYAILKIFTVWIKHISKISQPSVAFLLKWNPPVLLSDRRRGKPHRYGGSHSGNILTWANIYSFNHTPSQRGTDKKPEPKPLPSYTLKKNTHKMKTHMHYIISHRCSNE